VSVDYAALVHDDRIHASLYTDARIFADEIERIYARSIAARRAPSRVRITAGRTT
jgi:hypothetical protein